MNIIELTREAGFWQEHTYSWVCNKQDIERFAALVRAAALEEAAKACEARYVGDNNREDMEARRCAEEIRKLKEPTK